jgi:hypothetical protein
VKADSKQFDELVARCLAGECSPDELTKLRLTLSENADLKADYELMNLLFGKNKSDVMPADKRHFNRLSKRLEDEGLM